MTEQGQPHRTGDGVARDDDAAADRRPQGSAAAQRRTGGAAPAGSPRSRAPREDDPPSSRRPGRTRRGRTVRDSRTPARSPDVVERGKGGRWPVPERSVLATVLGVSPLVAVGLAAGLTALGVFADLARTGTLGTVFTICYVGGCVLAVAWVRRRSLFGPVVQPPLLLAAAVPVVVLLAGSPRPGTGISERLLTIGAPLVNSFPTMAWTTAAVLALGTGRLLAQRVPADERKAAGEPVSAPRERGGARGAARRSASPPPS